MNKNGFGREGRDPYHRHWQCERRGSPAGEVGEAGKGSAGKMGSIPGGEPWDILELHGQGSLGDAQVPRGREQGVEAVGVAGQLHRQGPLPEHLPTPLDAPQLEEHLVHSLYP